jgi:hypothetical protein
VDGTGAKAKGILNGFQKQSPHSVFQLLFPQSFTGDRIGITWEEAKA